TGAEGCRPSQPPPALARFPSRAIHVRLHAKGLFFSWNLPCSCRGMDKRILITGGAGFIGSHLADELLSGGYRVRALDSLIAQVHEHRARPAYLDDEV